MTRDRATLERLIAAHLPVTAVPGVPELRLHLAGPRSRLGRLFSGVGGDPPYWAHVWGGGLVLARYLLDHPDEVAGRRVLDLGCGSGLVAIAAARSGATIASATDIDPHAVAATRLNAALNGVAVEVRQADLLEGAAPDTDLVLVGDLFYDADLAPRVTTFLDLCAAEGRPALVGDPGRAALPRIRLQRLHAAAVADFGAGRDGVEGVVYRFSSRRARPVRAAPPRRAGS